MLTLRTIRRHTLTIACLFTAAPFASPVPAQTFTSHGAFFGVAGTPSYTETFESVPVPKNTPVPSFSQAGITYLGQAGIPYPNVYVSAPGFVGYAPGLTPTTTSILTANGDEDFFIQFLNPHHAVGFDVYYNGLGPLTSSFFNGTTLLASITYNGPAILGFNGYVSSAGAPVTSIRFVSTAGAAIDAGLDNLAVIDAPVSTTPEPATLSLLATGIVGLMIVRRRRGAAE